RLSLFDAEPKNLRRLNKPKINKKLTAIILVKTLYFVELEVRKIFNTYKIKKIIDIVYLNLTSNFKSLSFFIKFYTPLKHNDYLIHII
ncbi:hypothetical protein BUZ72_12540, partial [Staphylococcus saprophyticus]